MIWPYNFFQGILIGLAIAAPVGPIGVLCIQRSLSDGFRGGFVTGLGAATADAIYGLIAALGLTLVSQFLLIQNTWLQLLGSSYLLYLGLTILRKAPAGQAPVVGSGSLALGYFSAFGLTLTNPATIFSFGLIFSTLSWPAQSAGYTASLSLVVGVFLGSTGWWLTLSSGVTLFRNWATPAALRWVNRLAGLVILGYALAILLPLLR